VSAVFAHYLLFLGMKYEMYTDLIESTDLRVFEFKSIGKYGCISKRIAFVPTDLPSVYNLVFGDVNENNEIDDFSISDNGDRNKILATLVNVIRLYTDKYPERLIYFRGSTKERTRLYRMAVGLNLEELSKKFEIYGEVDGGMDFVPFYKNMKISGFLVKRKFI
jgi:hypothetical protein